MIKNISSGSLQSFPFPSQRVSDSEKEKAEWYANCCDWVIEQGLSIKDTKEVETKYGVLNGIIPDEFYKKTLNPYNSKEDKYTRFPATMRNYDIISGIIRRYVGEYIKNPHEFIVSAVNPEVILGKNLKLSQELAAIVEEQIAAKITESYQAYINEGNNPQSFNPKQYIDIEQFIKDFNQNYIDDISEQGQHVLNLIRQITDDTLIYARAYFDFVSFGEVYTYTEIIGDKLIKKCIPVRDAFPIPNNEMFVEDYDMFAERMKMTYQQIIDNYGEYLDESQISFLDSYYSKNSVSSVNTEFAFNVYQNYFPDLCNKFSEKEREMFKNTTVMSRDLNGDLYDVWRAVWRGESKKAIVTYVNEVNLITKRVENGNYKLNKTLGDISVEYVYEPQVYECVRIGSRNDSIYPFKARAIAYNRKGKLPYNGLTELLPGFGKFSIIKTILPYQVFYNIVSYHREMAIARNKQSILMIAKSLLGSNSEKTIYQMLADGVLYIDDTYDTGMIKAQQVRMLNASNTEYVNHLTNLLQHIELQAKEQVDMTPQRYGEIANSAGKSVTEEAIMRGSMGSVILEYIMDLVREKDYARDMDYSKFAWIDGLDTTIKNNDKNLTYFSLDVNKHTYADYAIVAKNSAKEIDKLNQIKSYAFNAGQNGQTDVAIAAILGDNVASIKNLIEEYQNLTRKHEKDMQAMEQQSKQMEQEFELKKIQLKGEQDRETVELESLLNKEIELIKADINILEKGEINADSITNNANDRLNRERNELDKEKLNIAREKNIIDAYNKSEDRKLKEKDINAKVNIAKTNKNRYDKK